MFTNLISKLFEKYINIYKVILFLSLSLLLVIGGLGYWNEDLLIFALIVSFLFLLLLFVKKKNNIILPPGLGIFLALLLFLGISLAWAIYPSVSFRYFIYFAVGVVFWVVFFNLGRYIETLFEKAFLGSAIILGVFAFLDKLNIVSLGKLPLSLTVRLTEHHHHIGDLFAIVLVFTLYKILSKIKVLYTILLAFSVYFLLISQSRSAYLASLGGLLFVLFKGGWVAKYKRQSYLVLATVVVLFFIASAFKTTIFSRIFYLHVYYLLLEKPFGVGLGGFGVISQLCKICYELELFPFSGFVHNIVLEIIVGIGPFGLIFLVWLFRVVKTFFKASYTENVIYQAVFLAVLINFSFDYTYFIPTMLWLWFASLGLAQASVHKG